VPSGRIQALARFATAAKASAIERLPEQRRLATLVVFALTLEATALDDALDLLDILITEIFSNATKAGEKARLRTIKDLDIAAKARVLPYAVHWGTLFRPKKPSPR
jgi:hypothetical protein